jgi:hypothetical protein
MKHAVRGQDRRQTSRRRSQFPAWVESAHRKPLQCTVLEFTLKGARLRAPYMALPNEFTLLLDQHSSFKRRCKVIWRKGFTVGLEFFYPRNTQHKLNAKSGKAKK